jgi:hypothetical protein
MYKPTYTYVYMHINTHAYMCICMYLPAWDLLSQKESAELPLMYYIYICMHIYIRIYIYIYIYIYTCVGFIVAKRVSRTTINVPVKNTHNFLMAYASTIAPMKGQSIPVCMYVCIYVYIHVHPQSRLWKGIAFQYVCMYVCLYLYASMIVPTYEGV